MLEFLILPIKKKQTTKSLRLKMQNHEEKILSFIKKPKN